MMKQDRCKYSAKGKLVKRSWGWGYGNKILTAVIAFLMILALGGCKESRQITSEIQTVEGYTDAQIMLLAVTEKNRYSEVYTDQIWQIPVDEEGTTFQEYLLGEVRAFLEEVKRINLLADKEGILLTSQEQERLRELSEDYYESLTEADRNYTNINLEEIYGLYTEYYRAGKMVDELTQNVNLEISDSEAKVIVVQELRVTDANEAQDIHTRVMAEDVDFSVVARAVSEDREVEKLVGRGERSQEYEEAVFSLITGEISPIIRDGDSFYIVKCINDYDEEATLERKQKLALQRKDMAFHKVYDGFIAEHSVNLDGEIWEKISFSEEEKSSTTGFFEWYEDYMGQ
ncbi:MAG: peptidylprolyl isomerase [Lachnospiraceae bacterium]|nr:peptidylprolyl isomerase [Lachnospiraceae bacterium]MCI9283355.1 peptidylprolyl isomerase [Lachnospiraceae bacterium]